MSAQSLEIERGGGLPVAQLLAENGYFRRSSSTFFSGASHKEWLHFAVHSPGLDLLVNFSVVDDTRFASRPGAEIPRITCLVREERWEGDIDQYQPGDVELQTGRLNARFGESRVDFEDGEFRLRVRMQRRPIEMDLRLVPLVVPTPAFNLQVEDCPPINWLVVPRLLAHGTVRIGDRVHRLENAPAYHDHNWGHFRWGKNFAWEWGHGAAEDMHDPWTMVFVRLTDRGHVSDLMQAVFLWKGPRQVRLFRARELEVWHSGLLRPKSVFKLPRVMGLVSPGAATDIPERLHVCASGAGDRVDFEFRCEDVAQVIIPNDEDLGVTIINEVSGQLELQGTVRGERFTLSCPSIFEFLGE